MIAPVIHDRGAVIHRPSATTEAHVLDALAHEQLGDRREAEASLERALDAAEPEGIVLPFVLIPVRDLLERLPPHRTAHPTLRQTILDVLDGEAPAAARTPSGPVDELSDAELRVVRYLPSNLRAPEIASELFVSTNTVRTHLRAHLRQARRPWSRRGGRPRPRARAPRPVAPRHLSTSSPRATIIRNA